MCVCTHMLGWMQKLNRGDCQEHFDFFDHMIMAPRQIPCYSAVIHLVKKDRKQQSELNSLNQNNEENGENPGK